MPLLTSCFRIDHKPANFTHPNGIKKIKEIIFKIDESNANILKQYVYDDVLEITADDIKKDMVHNEYDKWRR